MAMTQEQKDKMDPTPARGLAQESYLLRPEKVAEVTIDGAVAVAAGTHRFYNDTGRDLELVRVAMSIGTAPVGSALIADVNIGGVTVFTDQANRPKILAAANKGSAVPQVTEFPKDSYITVDIDAVGSGTAGSNLRIVVTAK